MSTTFDADGIKASAKNIGALMDDMTAFSNLKPQWPNAGHFELAQWLERIVDDRRNAIVAHAEHLKTAFEDMETTLTNIATDFENADGDNANKIKTSITELISHVESDISTMDKNTENDQHNFTPDSTSGNTNKPDDGDGYNDNLSDPI
ncbi:uncharacterized protein YukE [Amycolatopsis bartoniae]|uniref:Uncharacterized protein n=1 Tax=Amycolatopsis bartoniae TaxID=941986 RepID=A0A8H9M9X7_9PSEU|nr:hypothetical protein [Amycolatopsis bartoniae]MBB2934774.1 uncharacterized protein YukE [Amycolatopsis bartoniae]TVT02437.1 hypothetical protein FNH07_27380 [Amycolatopsis bartoniae]GHF44824.1 hypothetical protein GCM10017566_17320 [Amycolatopsis bartoniae]